MAAPNLRTLLDFETNVEGAAKTFLATDTGLSASSVFASIDQDDLVLPRVSVALELGEALDPVDPKTTGSTEFEYRKFTGSLIVIVASDGSTDGSQTAHRNIRADVRKSLLLNSDNFTTVPDDNVTGFTVTGQTDGSQGNYTATGQLLNGKPVFDRDLSSTRVIRYNGTFWIIYDDDEGESLWRATQSTDWPWQVTSWSRLAGEGSQPVFSDLVGTSILPYYDVKYLRPTSTNFEIDGDLAVSTLSYDIQFVIRDDAWPS